MKFLKNAITHYLRSKDVWQKLLNYIGRFRFLNMELQQAIETNKAEIS